MQKFNEEASDQRERFPREHPWQALKKGQSFVRLPRILFLFIQKPAAGLAVFPGVISQFVILGVHLH